MLMEAACSPTPTPPNGAASVPGGQTSGISADGGGANAGGAGTDGTGLQPLPPCDSADDADGDGDGFSIERGDCYDCDPLINPGAYDFPDNGYDEDCRAGDSRESAYLCDAALSLASVDPESGARAIGLCNFASKRNRRWGVLSARYTSADGSRELSPDEFKRVGILPGFGLEEPRQGGRMLALSSGIARSLSQSGFTETCSDVFTAGIDGWPMGYPRDSPACGAGSDEDDGPPLLFDPTALELELRVPTNAKGLSFDTNFYTYEFPDYICTEFNDYFLVLMDPSPEDHVDGNIVFDADGNWISVNNALLQVCEAGTYRNKTFSCPLGTKPLRYTGYSAGDTPCGGGAATGWLRTEVPVTPGATIRLRFAIWDTGDPNRDSTVLIDHVAFSVESPPEIATSPVVF